jgi:hypothetical protein
MTHAYQASIESAARLSISAADALGDSRWFAERPTRLFRARLGNGGLWLIRRRCQGADPDVYLRTFSASIAPPCGDSDGEIAPLRFQAAYPDWPPERVQKFARKALRKSGRP